MKTYRDFILPQIESGQIIKCERQVKFELQKGFKHNGKNTLPINYVADFVVTDKDNHVIVYDSKGQPDAVAKLKRKLFWCVYPDVDYRWICWVKKFGGWLDWDDAERLRKEEKKKKTKQY